MFGRSWKFWLIGAVVAAALLTGTSEANAWWCGYGCYQPASCYTPCYTSCYTPCYTVSYTASCDPYGGGGWYAGVRPGPIRRLLFGPYRWYWSPYYGTPIAYDVCCTQTGFSAATPTPTPAAATPTPATRTPVEPPVSTYLPVDPPDTPATEPATEPADVLRDLPGIFPGDTLPNATIPDLNPVPGTGDEPAPIVPGTEPAPAFPPGPATIPETGTPMSSIPTRENSGLLTVWVPYNAKVTINGMLTKSKGSQRRFVSFGLKPDLDYKYVIRAEAVISVVEEVPGFDENSTGPKWHIVDRLVVEENEVILTAGDRKAVAFGFNPDVAGGLVAR